MLKYHYQRVCLRYLKQWYLYYIIQVVLRILYISSILICLSTLFPFDYQFVILSSGIAFGLTWIRTYVDSFTDRLLHWDQACQAQGRLVYLWERQKQQDPMTLLLVNESYPLMKSYHERHLHRGYRQQIQWKYILVLILIGFICKPWSYYARWIEINTSIRSSSTSQSYHKLNQTSSTLKRLQADENQTKKHHKTFTEQALRSSSQHAVDHPNNALSANAKNSQSTQSKSMKKTAINSHKKNHKKKNQYTPNDQSKIQMIQSNLSHGADTKAIQSSRNKTQSILAMKQAQSATQASMGKAAHLSKTQDYKMSTQSKKKQKMKSASTSMNHSSQSSSKVVSSFPKVAPLTIQRFPTSSRVFLKRWQKQKR